MHVHRADTEQTTLQTSSVSSSAKAEGGRFGDDDEVLEKHCRLGPADEAKMAKHPLTKAGITPPFLLVGPSSDPRLPFTHLLELRQSLNLGKLGLLPQVEPCRNRYSRRGIGKIFPQLGLDPLVRRPSPIPCGWGSFLGLEEGNQ